MKTQAQVKLQEEINHVREIFNSDNRGTWNFESYKFAKNFESNREWFFSKTLTTITLYIL